MTENELAFAAESEGRPSVVCNFGVFAGREATPAEIDRLGETLLAEVGSFEIVSERRASFGPDRRASLHQVRVELPRASAGEVASLVPAVEAWARDCIGERGLLAP